MIAVLAGDSIGPEIVAEAVKVLKTLRGPQFQFELKSAPVGAAACLLAGHPLPTRRFAWHSPPIAVLFGAVGDPRFDHLEPATAPKAGDPRAAPRAGLFASLKQVSVPPELEDLSPLRRERAAGIDLLVVRELNGDVYTGQPRGVRPAPDGPFAGEREGYDTMRYADGEVRRIAHVAFRTAQARSKRLCNVDKANVLETSRVWREVVEGCRPRILRCRADASLCRQRHNAAHRQSRVLRRHPGRKPVWRHPVRCSIRAHRLDRSACLRVAGRGPARHVRSRPRDCTGHRRPRHGNPLACIRAAARMQRHSLGRDDLAQRIERAVTLVLRQGYGPPRCTRREFAWSAPARWAMPWRRR